MLKAREQTIGINRTEIRGSSVANAEADECSLTAIETYRQGNQVVVVLSAGDTTDELISDRLMKSSGK